jgi:hypothetical protein
MKSRSQTKPSAVYPDEHSDLGVWPYHARYRAPQISHLLVRCTWTSSTMLMSVSAGRSARAGRHRTGGGGAVTGLPQWTSQGGGMSASRLGGGGAPPRPTHFDLGDDAPVCIFWSFGSSRSAPRGGGVLLWWDRVRARRRRRCLGGHRGWVGVSFAATGASQVDGGGGRRGRGCGRLR